MPRRSHKKSRQGCQECKRRHVKCDETRPRCINCVTANLKCPYGADRRPGSHISTPPSSDEIDQTDTSPNSIISRCSASTSLAQTSSHSDGEPPLNMLHLELMYWWSTGLYKTFLLSLEAPQTYSDSCLRNGLQFPFLMRQILATSALNLSLVRPDQRNLYHQHATQLQSEALTGFNATLQNLNETNIVPAFLNSSLIGIHSFCETFSFREDSFSQTLDSLISCIHLLRGVRSLIGNWWEFLLASELAPVLNAARDRRHRMTDDHYRLDDLERLLSNEDISPASRETYKEVIVDLAKLFSPQARLSEVEASESANMIFSWLVVIPKEFVDMLSARRPEALIILSYYGVVLHQRRRFWAIGDSGKYLIDSIDAHLGQHWDEWLAWPRSMVLR